MLRRAQLAFSLGVVSCLTYACGVQSPLGSKEQTTGPATRSDAGNTPTVRAEAAPSQNGALAPTQTGVIVVHAAGVRSFRLCFENMPDLLPQPDAIAMPEANVVGVEVGSAVRIDPLSAPPGRVFLYEETVIRALYPAFGAPGRGPSCGELLQSSGPEAIEVGAITSDLSQGVHLLIVRGCPKAAPLRPYSTRECGTDYLESVGNLAIQERLLQPSLRPSASQLPVQVVHLSQALESARASKLIDVRFGDLSNDAAMVDVSEAPPLFGDPQPSTPRTLDYAPDATAAYATHGFRVTLVDPGAIGAAGAVVLDQSLAAVQKLSAPRAIPPLYYAQASNYVLLLLGDPTPTLKDGGVDDDPLRSLHFLAVPVVAPEKDAGPSDARAD